MDVVLFDLDDTLYDQVMPFEMAFSDVIGPVDGPGVSELFHAYKHHSEELFQASADGTLAIERMRILRIQRTCTDFGIVISSKTAEAFQQAYTWNQYHAITLTPAIRALLTWCADNVRIGIVTNGPDAHQRAKAHALSLEEWFSPERVFVSEALGMAKPGAAIFRHAAAALGATAGDCVYVGDSPTNDVAGACSAGMPVMWFDRRGNPLVAGARPTWTVSREEEILPLLQTIRQGE